MKAVLDTNGLISTGVPHEIVVKGVEGEYEIVGAAGLSIDWDRRAGTLGTWLRKSYWGRGSSGERAAALIELAFEQLDLEIIEVSHHPE